MRRWPHRGALVLLGGLAVLAPAALPAALAAGSPGRAIGACADDSGVTVVVDKTAFGGGVEVRCAAQPVRSGFDALTKAGFSYSGTVSFPGLLCRIDGQPSADPCQGAPPPNAYWGYWHADRGGDWTYSRAGASRTPPPGSVEGWAFGDDAEPGVAPPAPAPRPPAPTTTRPTTAGPTPAAPAVDGGPTTTAEPASPGTPPTTVEALADPSEVDASSGDPAPLPQGGRGATDEQASSAPGPPTSGESGSPAGVLVTAGLLAAGGAMGLRHHLRRDGG